MANVFPARLIAAMQEEPIVVIDLGARGAIDADLLDLAPAVSVIGFEPDQAEAERLAKALSHPWLQRRILPCAIAGQGGPATLHVPREPEGASLLPHNEGLIEEFGHEGLHRTLKKVSIEAKTLDDAAGEIGLQYVDYLKIDIEGAELDVLKGSPILAPTAKVMKIECAFIEQRVGQPLAVDVISHLARTGFQLIDIRATQHWRRRPLPAHPYATSFEMPYSRGRIAQADLFFMREFGPGSSGRDVAAAMLVLVALGYVDLAVAALRRSAAAQAWWTTRGVEIEPSLRQVSQALGKREVAKAITTQARGLVPLLKSRLGRLAFRRPERPY